MEEGGGKLEILERGRGWFDLIGIEIRVRRGTRKAGQKGKESRGQTHDTKAQTPDPTT